MFKSKEMLGVLLFEADNGLYATCNLRPSTGLLTVIGGSRDDDWDMGGDCYHKNLSTQRATSIILRTIGEEHHEDVWVDVHELIKSHQLFKIAEFERRIKEI